jgi:hypothetical protein
MNALLNASAVYFYQCRVKRKGPDESTLSDMFRNRLRINFVKADDPFGVAAQREYYGVQTAIHVSKRCKTLFAAPIARDGYRIVPIEPHNVFEVASVFGDVRQPLAFVPLVSHISSFSTG